MTGFVQQGDNLVGIRIDRGRLELVGVLGLGAYGVVYEAVDVTTRGGKPRRFAVKSLVKAGLDTRQRQFQRREIALHQLASAHKHVVTMYRMIEEGDFIFVILDYCTDGDLFGMITERQRYVGDDALIRRVFLQIIDAVDYCHSLGIFHRDLKPENIMTTEGGRTVYLGDFGLATTEKISRDFGCGSTFYMSPECQGGLLRRGAGYSTQANDTWSLGVILVNLTCGRNPWRQATLEDETFAAFARDPSFLRSILPISRSLSQILQQIFTLDAKSRISLSALRQLIAEVDTFTMTATELRAAYGVPVRIDEKAVEDYHDGQPNCKPDDAPSSSNNQTFSDAIEGVSNNTPATPLLVVNRSRSYSSDGTSLPPTPNAAASEPPTQSLLVDEFCLDGYPNDNSSKFLDFGKPSSTRGAFETPSSFVS